MTAWMRVVAVSTALMAVASATPAFAAGQDPIAPGQIMPGVPAATMTMPDMATNPANPVAGYPANASAPAPAMAQATMPKPALPQLSLNDRVIGFVDYGNEGEQEDCLATAVFYEARGESLEGQLAVAQVILNRTRSGRYPTTICGVVTQPAQFSFVRDGQLPAVDRKDACWHKALAIADVALKNEAGALPGDVLWYHASYVDPRWNRTMTRTVQIGSHIFYS